MYTAWRTRASRAIASSRRVPSTSVAWYLRGDSGSEAAWMITSMSFTATSSPAPVTRSPCTQSSPSACLRLSTRARWPSSMRRRTTSRPSAPVPPVTSTCMTAVSLCGRADRDALDTRTERHRDSHDDVRAECERGDEKADRVRGVKRDRQPEPCERKREGDADGDGHPRPAREPHGDSGRRDDEGEDQQHADHLNGFGHSDGEDRHESDGQSSDRHPLGGGEVLVDR